MRHGTCPVCEDRAPVDNGIISNHKKGGQDCEGLGRTAVEPHRPAGSRSKAVTEPLAILTLVGLLAVLLGAVIGSSILLAGGAVLFVASGAGFLVRRAGVRRQGTGKEKAPETAAETTADAAPAERQPQEDERREAERLETERLETERREREAERRVAERLEAERREREAERREREREAERLEAERLEAERREREAERRVAERLEAERREREAERREREAAEAARHAVREPLEDLSERETPRETVASSATPAPLPAETADDGTSLTPEPVPAVAEDDSPSGTPGGAEQADGEALGDKDTDEAADQAVGETADADRAEGPAPVAPVAGAEPGRPVGPDEDGAGDSAPGTPAADETPGGTGETEGDSAGDPFARQAEAAGLSTGALLEIAEAVVTEQNAAIAYVQQRFSLSRPVARRALDALEQLGVVSAPAKNGRRKATATSLDHLVPSDRS